MAKIRRKKKKELEIGVRAIGEYRGVKVVIQRDPRFPKQDFYMWFARAELGYARSFNAAKYGAREYIDKNVRGCEVVFPIPVWNYLKHLAWHEEKMDIEEFVEQVTLKYIKVLELRKKKESITRRKKQIAFDRLNGKKKVKKRKRKRIRG